MEAHSNMGMAEPGTSSPITGYRLQYYSCTPSSSVRALEEPCLDYFPNTALLSHSSWRQEGVSVK